MINIIEKLLQKNGLVCEVYQCGECGEGTLVPQPSKNYFVCDCGYMYDSCGVIRIKGIDLLPTINIKVKKHVKQSRKHKK